MLSGTTRIGRTMPQRNGVSIPLQIRTLFCVGRSYFSAVFLIFSRKEGVAAAPLRISSRSLAYSSASYSKTAATPAK